jgi:hypothetical protein
MIWEARFMARNVKQLAGLGQAESAPGALFARWGQSSMIHPDLATGMPKQSLSGAPRTKAQKPETDRRAAQVSNPQTSSPMAPNVEAASAICRQ